MDTSCTRSHDRRMRSRANAQARGLAEPARQERVCLITLGCAKNQVDAERMAHSLLEAGFRFTADPRRADVLILSTCSFIQDAVRESLSTARQLARYKRDGSCRSLVVTGCLVQRLGPDLFERLPEADLFAGLSAAARAHPGPSPPGRFAQNHRPSASAPCEGHPPCPFGTKACPGKLGLCEDL